MRTALEIVRARVGLEKPVLDLPTLTEKQLIYVFMPKRYQKDVSASANNDIVSITIDIEDDAEINIKVRFRRVDDLRDRTLTDVGEYEVQLTIRTIDQHGMHKNLRAKLLSLDVQGLYRAMIGVRKNISDYLRRDD